MSEADTQDQTDQQIQDVDNSQDTGKWFDSLSSADLRNNPTLQKYTSAEEAHKGHLELQKTLGSDRVAWPKDANDETAWAEVNKRMGVPEKPDGYNLNAVKAPEGLGMETFDKFAFQEQMKAINASPAQATKLWDDYTNMISDGVATAAAEFQTRVDNVKSEMMQEYGEGYQGMVERGQLVIGHFAKNETERDEVTVALAGTASGVRMLGEIGKMMSETSVGGFQEKKSFTLTPAEARIEMDTIKANPDYMSDDDRVRIPLINRANDLMKMIGPGAQQRQVIA